MNKVEEALKKAKKCKGCGGYLEPKFGDYHPICNPKNKSHKRTEVCKEGK